jgi:hypothetical protein
MVFHGRYLKIAGLLGLEWGIGPENKSTPSGLLSGSQRDYYLQHGTLALHQKAKTKDEVDEYLFAVDNLRWSEVLAADKMEVGRPLRHSLRLKSQRELSHAACPLVSAL